MPVLAMMRGYLRSWLRGDLVGGVTAAAYLVPHFKCCLAFTVPRHLTVPRHPFPFVWSGRTALVVRAGATGVGRMTAVGGREVG